MSVLKGIKPERVFCFFEEICKIPHGSGNTKKISDFCVDFAKQNNLKYYQDSLNNVVIYKSGSKGYESKNPVIIQGHLDMVCEKDASIDFDFSKDALNLKLSGDFLSATGTTLGGDDGIAVAFALAVLEDKTLKHPPIEAFFTVDEETGMYGAEGFDYSNLKGKTLINIDSEDEGVLTVGCAGGARTDITLPLEKVNLNGSVISIKIDGLLGGHSGVEINKGRHNANVLMGKFLNKIGKFNLVALEGGKKDNVIPSVCQAIISAECDVSAIAKSFIAENSLETDPKLNVTVENLSNVDFKTCYSAEASKKAAELICALPNGIIKMCPDIKGLVQTSLNMGVMELKDNSLHISFAVRSSVNEEKTELIKVVEDTAKSFGAESYSHSHYPAWEYKKDSPLRKTMSAVYKELYKQDVVVEVIHAGLECGLFCDKIKDLDAVSFGPDLYDIHSPLEKVSISSVERCYEFLVKVLEKL